MGDQIVNLDAILQKLPKGYSFTVREMHNDQFWATLSNSGAGVYVTEARTTAQEAVDACYERYMTTYKRDSS